MSGKDLTRTGESFGSGDVLGRHYDDRYAPGMGEEMEPKLTWTDRAVRWLMDRDFVPEERLWLLQEARRLKMRNDAVQARLHERIMKADSDWQEYQKRQKKLGLTDEYRDVGFWSHAARYNSGTDKKPNWTDVRMRYTLLEKKGGRKIEFSSAVRMKDGGFAGLGKDDADEYIVTTRAFLEHVRPWVDGKHSIEKLREAFDEETLVIY